MLFIITFQRISKSNSKILAQIRCLVHILQQLNPLLHSPFFRKSNTIITIPAQVFSKFMHVNVTEAFHREGDFTYSQIQVLYIFLAISGTYLLILDRSL